MSKVNKTPNTGQKTLANWFTKTPTQPSATSPTNIKSPPPSFNIAASGEDKENLSEAVQPVTKSETVTNAKHTALDDNEDSKSSDDAGFTSRRAPARKSATNAVNNKNKRAVVSDNESEYDDGAAAESDASASDSDSSLSSVSDSEEDQKASFKPNKRQKTNSAAVSRAKPAAQRKPANKTAPVVDLIANSDDAAANSEDDEQDAFTSTRDAAESTKFDFVKRGIRLDAQMRPESHPDYDPRTLYVPQNKDLTPGERQYFELKKDNMDVVLLYKMGKFYECFDDDADVCVEVCGLNYMGRQTRRHAGFPEQALDKWATKLIKAGKRIARVEQVETPAELAEANRNRTGKKKNIVNRKLINMSSRGIQRKFDDLQDTAAFVLSVYEHPLASPTTDLSKAGEAVVEFGVTYFDRATAQFTVGQFKDDSTCSRLRTVIAQLQPIEIMYSKSNLTEHTLTVLQSEKPTTCELVMMYNAPGTQPKPGYVYDVKQTVASLHSKQYFSNDDLGLDNPTYTVPTIIDDDQGANAEQEYEDWPATLSQLYTGRVADCDGETAILAFGLMLSYLQRCIDDTCVKLKNFRLFDLNNIRSSGRVCSAMHLDGQTLQNLEVLVNEQGKSDGTLLSHVDKCRTAFGKRQLREWVIQPLRSIEHINERLDAVEELMSDVQTFAAIRDRLKQLPDLDRLLQGIHQHASPEDTEAVMYTNVGVKKVKDFCAALDGFETASKLIDGLKTKAYTSTLLQRCINNYPDIDEALQFFVGSFDRKQALKSGEIEPRPTVNEKYDFACKNIMQIKQELQDHMKTEVKKMRGCSEAKYIDKINEPFQIEIPANVKPPESFSYVSSTKQVKRYYTPFIKQRLPKLELAEDNKERALKDTLRQLFAQFMVHYTVWKKCVTCLAELDCLLSLAITSQHQNAGSSVRPVFVLHADNGGKSLLEVRSGVHPVLCGSDDTVTDVKGESKHFIPNDTVMGCSDNPAEFILVTGANMGGKSTILRQTCQIVILAQIGCFVPAQSCRLTPVDRIFTRVGANDKIMAGMSTFMVELSETAIILKQATPHSLVILDELGRGTSTFDGTAIAYAVIQYLAEEMKCMTLFSTHYHMLIRDFIDNPNVALYKMDVASGQSDILFMYKFVKGYVAESHGMHVAHMADLPDEVIRMARLKADEMLINMNAAYDPHAPATPKQRQRQYQQRVSRLYNQSKAAVAAGDAIRARDCFVELQRLVSAQAAQHQLMN